MDVNPVLRIVFNNQKCFHKISKKILSVLGFSKKWKIYKYCDAQNTKHKEFNRKFFNIWHVHKNDKNENLIEMKWIIMGEI